MSAKQEKAKGPGNLPGNQEDQSTQAVSIDTRRSNMIDKFIEEHKDFQRIWTDTSLYHNGYEDSDERQRSSLVSIGRKDSRTNLYISTSIDGRDLTYPTEEHPSGIEWDDTTEKWSAWIEYKADNGKYIQADNGEEPLLTKLLSELLAIS